MSGVPFLVTAPTVAPVSLLDMKDHLRVTDDAQDAVILALIGAAVGHLDGFSGVLGRAIMPQTWAQEWDDGSQTLLIAMPDASGVVVESDGATVSSTKYTVKRTFSGLSVALDGVTGDTIRVEYTCGMGAAMLDTARHAIKLLVECWHERDDAGQAAIDALVTAIRWRA
jgi:uncharacterized phiE125 gp8 family phage protein